MEQPLKVQSTENGWKHPLKGEILKKDNKVVSEVTAAVRKLRPKKKKKNQISAIFRDAETYFDIRS